MKTYNHAFQAMGCPCAFRILATDKQTAQSARTAAQREVERLDRKYSHYKPDSELARIQTAANCPDGVSVDKETAALLDYAQLQWELSYRRFDITARHLTALWEGRTTPPAADELAAALSRTGWHKVAWDGERLALPAGFRLDLGGLVKEYAADRTAAIMRKHGIRRGYVDLGGDLHFLGPPANGEPWQVGIRDPEKRDRPLASIGVRTGGLASSGDYERFSLVDGERYSHLVDPRNGMALKRSSQSLVAVSVTAASCLLAGSMATIAMLLGRAAGIEFLHTSGLVWLATSTDGQIYSAEMLSQRRASDPGRGSRRKSPSLAKRPSSGFFQPGLPDRA